MVAERNSRKHNFIKQNVETAGHWCAAGRGERLVELTNMKAERAREAQASRQEMQRLRIERILERIGRRERHEELVRAAERGRRTANDEDAAAKPAAEAAKPRRFLPVLEEAVPGPRSAGLVPFWQ